MSNTLSKSLRVEEENLACAMGSGSLAVLATPAVVALMENAAAALADEILADETLTTVGTMISIEHTSPTPIAAEVTATAVLTSRDGRFFHFTGLHFHRRKFPEVKGNPGNKNNNDRFDNSLQMAFHILPP